MRTKSTIIPGVLLVVALLIARFALVDVRDADVPLPTQRAEITRIASKLDPQERDFFKQYMQAYELQLLVDADRAWKTMGIRTVRQAIDIGRQASQPSGVRDPSFGK